jgi:hypothetical protein
MTIFQLWNHIYILILKYRALCSACLIFFKAQLCNWQSRQFLYFQSMIYSPLKFNTTLEIQHKKQGRHILRPFLFAYQIFLTCPKSCKNIYLLWVLYSYLKSGLQTNWTILCLSSKYRVISQFQDINLQFKKKEAFLLTVLLGLCLMISSL